MKKIWIILSCIIAGTLIVTLLFLSSEEKIHRNNSFIRRYPHHPVTREHSFDLNFNSYYVAGTSMDSVYLGNHTAPLHILAIDKNLSDTVHHKISLEKMEQFKFKSVKIFVGAPFFYLADGTVPVIYRGEITNWKAKILSKDEAYFSQIAQLGSSAFGIRARSRNSNENELGLIELSENTKIRLKPKLLEKQIDGIFDVDGFLIYNQNLEKLLYVYRYRNQFLVMDNHLNLEYRGRTIDTISRAQLDISEISSKDQRKLGVNSIPVQLDAATGGKYLFTRSNRLGKYEQEKMLEQASIIDVYNITEHSYEFSFYLYHLKQEKMREFLISDSTLYSLHGKYLVKHKMKPRSFDF